MYIFGKCNITTDAAVTGCYRLLLLHRAFLLSLEWLFRLPGAFSLDDTGSDTGADDILHAILSRYEVQGTSDFDVAASGRYFLSSSSRPLFYLAVGSWRRRQLERTCLRKRRIDRQVSTIITR